MPRVIALVSNIISASMLEAALERDQIRFDEVYLISGRRLPQKWTAECACYIEFSKKPALTMIGQLNTLSFYKHSVRNLKRWLRDPEVEQVYISNSDNLLSNHVLRWAERHPKIQVNVVAEGNMNYHSVGRENRAWWRWWIKPPVALALGLRYRMPIGHLSGSFEPRVNRVLSYTAANIQAPHEKVEVIPFKRAEVKVTPDAGGVLVLLTGISQWMKEDDFVVFRAGFGRWIRSLGATKIWVKPHPNYPSGNIEEELGVFEWLGDTRGIESMASEIPAQKVVGYWSTGLVTLKLIRPDLNCIDFGHDFYTRTAYHGDSELARVLKATGVEMVDMEPWANE